MSEARYSIVQTAGGRTRPLLDLRNNPNDAQRFVEAQKAMYDFVASFVDQSISARQLKIKSSFILKAHKLGFDFIDKDAGWIRNVPVCLTNSTHRPPSHKDVLILLEELCDYVNENTLSFSGPYISAYFLRKFLWIHPFVEGNGSLGRLISNAIIQISFGSFLPGAQTLPVFIAQNREDYYSALTDADKHFLNGEINVSKLEELIIRLLDHRLVAIS